jgi:lysophospholipase L1-like esterase
MVLVMSLKLVVLVTLCALILAGIAYISLPKNTKLSISYVLEDISEPSTTLLLGSSTITRFPTQKLQQCKTPKTRGFSNGHASDVINYLSWREIEEPQNVFIYVGENDIAHGKSVSTALKDLSEIIAYFETYPKTSIGILLIKPSPVREQFHEAFAQFNSALIEQYKDNTTIHIVEMNKFSSQAYYLRDGIHLTRFAYDSLSALLDDVCLKSRPL